MTLTYNLGQEDGLYKALQSAGVLIEEEAPISTADTGNFVDEGNRAWGDDADLPICTACGTQYPTVRDDCPICEDDR
jgi:hypothetical protein